MIGLLLFAVALLVLSGLAAALAGKSQRWCTGLGVGGAVSASLIGLIPAARVFLGAPAASLRLAWDVPYGVFFVELDALSAFFLLPIFALSALAAIFGSEYLAAQREGRGLGPMWLFFNLLVASMVLVVIARNGVLFLMAWEVMTLASFFLVTSDDEQTSVREAGWIYLVATHLGTACLLALFILLGRQADSLDFDRFAAPESQAGILFLLAVVGFGVKAGFVPLHVWLPEAHPAAPSHVSAVMSGVMIKTGIYGLVRILTLLGPPPAWWGWVLCGAGLISGVYGVVFALAQRDLKRLLAYSSVENIGIVTLGLGIGMLGLSANAPALAVLGFAGGLLHALNHAMFKGLLFLGAGTVAHATGSHDLARLGGLLERMPWSGAAFIAGAAAISGLPPLNGFASELLIYLGALRGATPSVKSTAVPALAAAGGLALIGGLAVACFTRAAGLVFLGTPRSSEAGEAHEPGAAMRLPLLALAAACVATGLLAPAIVRRMAPLLITATRLPPGVVTAEVAAAARSLVRVAAVGTGFIALVAALTGLRDRLLAGRNVTAAPTWDCGYAQPTARMQYTASSFSQPLTSLFAMLLQTREVLEPPEGLFPSRASLSTETPDVCADRAYAPAFDAAGRGLASLRWLQHGNVHLYVLYIALTLLALLLWKLG